MITLSDIISVLLLFICIAACFLVCIIDKINEKSDKK